MDDRYVSNEGYERLQTNLMKTKSNFHQYKIKHHVIHLSEANMIQLISTKLYRKASKENRQLT